MIKALIPTTHHRKRGGTVILVMPPSNIIDIGQKVLETGDERYRKSREWRIG